MIQNIEIRPCTDAALLCELNKDLQNLHHTMYPLQFKKHRTEALLPAFEAMLARINSHAYVAWQGNEALGYIMLFVQDRAESAFQYEMLVLHLDQIFVYELYRPLGVGRLFMDHVKALALEMGADRVQLDHWTANDRARSFFKKSGFSYFNERMEYVL